MSLRDLPRLARTVVHLRPSQVLWRARYAVSRRYLAPSHGASEPVPAHCCRSDLLTRFCEQQLLPSPTTTQLVDEDAVVDRLSQGIFRHLNEERPLGRPPDWLLGPRYKGRLWTVTLHYHEWAMELAAIVTNGGPRAAEAGQLYCDYLDDWIERCDLAQPGARHLAWNSYAIGTRLDSWGRSAWRLGSTWWSDNVLFAERFLSSFWRQAQHLANNIEWDLRGNHLVRDAVGLAWAGRLFEGPQASHWLDQARGLALDQAREQVLADGGHFERSPMYHQHVMHDLQTISELVEGGGLRDVLACELSRMDDFAAWMRHPDGGLVLFNDAALDDDSFPSDITHAEANLQPRGGRHFADTGIAVWHGSKWALFFDVGPIGPDYQPGHSHADNLTLECSYAGERLFVDPGTYAYDRDERRAYDRSTAAHNTVCVDQTDSSEVWHIFRAGRRARPIDVQVVADPSHFDATAAHDGYARLGNVIHRRRVQLSEGETLTVTDRVEGHGHHQLEGGWLLAPLWTASPTKAGWCLQHAGRSVRVRLRGPNGLQLRLETKPWHPRFGVEIPTTRLVWRWDGALPFELITSVAPLE